MSPLERLDAAARRREGPAPRAAPWILEAAREGVAAAETLTKRLADPRPLEPVHLALLRALSRAWHYGDALPDIPPDLHLALGDWAAALMDAERHLRGRRKETFPPRKESL